jgi:hypothetical protein
MMFYNLERKLLIMNEKKISIVEVTNPCADCKVPGLDCGLCGLRIRFNRLPTREQVIMDIAKAICCYMYKSCKGCSFNGRSKDCKDWLKKNHYQKAEAVLNANILLRIENETMGK